MATVNDLIKRIALHPGLPGAPARGGYIAPLYSQAKAVAWDYLKYYTKDIPGVRTYENELRADLPTGGRVQLFGADNPDSLRGSYFDEVVLDEYAQMRPKLWPEVIRPMLADRQGGATFIGTPMGRNEFWELWQKGRKTPDKWFAFMLKASESGILDAQELLDAQLEMSKDQYAQEFECSFDAAVVGAYYAQLITQAEKDGRVKPVPWEPTLPVHTAWDLGRRNALVIWFFQIYAREVRIIDYYEMTGASLTACAAEVLERKQRGWAFGEHILPHDAKVVELTREDGKSRKEILRALGIHGKVLDADNVSDGIEAVRVLLPRCYFDSGPAVARGIAHLREYKQGYDERLKVLRPAPVHDIHSDAADSFRTLAMGLPKSNPTKREPIKYGPSGIV